MTLIIERGRFTRDEAARAFKEFFEGLPEDAVIVLEREACPVDNGRNHCLADKVVRLTCGHMAPAKADT